MRAAFLNSGPATVAPSPDRLLVHHRPRFRRGLRAGKLGAFMVGLVVVLAPLPAASNHPLAWLFWATLLGAWASLIMAMAPIRLEQFSPFVRRVLLLGVCFAGFAVFQAMPTSLSSDRIELDLPNADVTTRFLSVAPGATLLAAIRIFSYLIFFAMVVGAGRDPFRAKRLATFIFYGVAAQGLYAIISLQYLGDTGLTGQKTAFFGAATGSFINKNSLATFLGMGLILGLSLLLSDLRRTKPGTPLGTASGIVGLCIISTALFMTQSRLGIAATGIATAVVIHGSLATRSTKVFLIAAGITTATLLLLLSPTEFFDLQVSAQTRLDLYRQIVEMVAQRPLVGFGLDGFGLAYEPYHRLPVTAEFVWDKGHSTYLTLWVEAGLFFGSIPPLIGLLVLGALWQRLRVNNRGRSLSLAAVGALILCGVHSLADFSLEIQANVFLLLAICGLGLNHRPDEKGYS